MIHRKRRLLPLASVLAVVALLAFFTPADAGDQIFQFDIPAEALSQALTEFSQASSQQIIFSEDLTKGLKTSGLHGRYTAEQALDALLSGTDLKAEKNSAGVLMVRPKNVQASESEGAAEVVTDKMNPQNFDKDQHTAQSAALPPLKAAQLEEITVTGSRIPLAAGQQQIQPVRSYTREDIVNSGQSTMGEFLNTLPDVSTITNGPVQTGFAGVQTVQLHGLPIGTTLTLLNGRRLETSSLGFFDLSNIPIAAVERIEIMPTGASAIYGADALAGAVNMILRKDFTGLEVNATLDQAPDVNDPGVNLAWGKKWDRGSVSLIASYEHHGDLLGTQREPTSSTSFPVNAPMSTLLLLGTDTCAPGNVYSIDGVSNLPGVSSWHAGIPAGVTGRPTVAQFGPTSGKPNVCNTGRYYDITPRSDREGVLVSAHHELTDSADLFTEVLLSHRTLRFQSGPQLAAYASFNGTVAAANPYNPFGQDVNVSFVYPGAGLQENNTASLIRPVVGVRGVVLSDWNYEVTATLSRDRLHDVGSFEDYFGVAAALQSSDPAAALNPFTSGAPGPPKLLQSFITSDSTIFDDQTVSAQALIRGPLVNLSTGKLQTVVGAELNQERQNTTDIGTATALQLQRNTYATFAEARVPLLARGAPPQHEELLTLALAGRYDHSGDYGGKATWQGGLQWRATEVLSLNGSYGQSYRAPQLKEIAGSQSTFVGPLGVSDPFRGGEAANYNATILSGPNFELKPETGTSSSLQVAYAANSRSGLRGSLTWYDLRITNYIATPSAQAVVDNPSLYPGAVVRAPPTSQDRQQGFLGVITRFYNGYQNFGDVRVDGFDADVAYAIDTRIGQFTPSLAIANIYKWQSALVPGAPIIDSVSKATDTGVGWAPRWKGTAALAWKRGVLSANVAGRYLGRYLDYQDFFPNNDHEIGNTWIFDVGVRAELGKAFASHAPELTSAYVAIRAVNVFNRIPPFSLTGVWYDQQQYDLRGRYLRLSFGVRF